MALRRCGTAGLRSASSRTGAALIASAALLLAFAAYSGLADMDLLQAADAHSGKVRITSAVLTDPHTIHVTYSGSVPAPTQEQRKRATCWFGGCLPGGGTETVRTQAGRYSDVVLQPGGSVGISSVAWAAFNAHYIYLSGSGAAPDATGSLSVDSSGSYTWTGAGHRHTRDAARVSVSDGQGPGIVPGSAALDLSGGSLQFRLNEPLSSTDPSKISISGVSLSGATVVQVSDDKRSSLMLTEAQRSGLAALQDGAGGLAADLAAGAFADAVGNWSGPASGVQLSVTKDTTPPSLVLADSSLDLDAGVLVLGFSEYIDISEADVSAVRLQDSSGSAELGVSASQVREDSDGRTVTVDLTDLQRAQIINPAAFPPSQAPAEVGALLLPVVRQPSTGADLTLLSVPAGAFRDLAGIKLSSAASGEQIRTVADSTAPQLRDGAPPSLDQSSGVLRFEFDEYVDVRGADFAGMALADRFDGRVSLENAAVRSDGRALVLTLPDPDRESAINMRADVLLMAAGSITDVSGNGVAESSSSIAVIRDGTSPALMRASLDANKLVLVFSETVDATPAGQVDLSKMSMRAPQFSASQVVQLYSGFDRATVDSTADGARVDITLTDSQRSRLAAGQSGTLLLSLEAGAVHDLAGNYVAAGDGHRVGASLDTAGPSASSAELTLDGNAAKLKVNFDETIDATPASQVDASAFSLRDSGAGTSAPRTALSSAAVEGFDRAYVTLTLTEAQRQKVISYGAAPLLDVAAGAARDLAGNPASAVADIAVSLTTSDTVVPELTSAYLDQGTGQLRLTFNETVSISSMDLSKLSIQEAPVVVEAAPESSGNGVCFPDLGGTYRWSISGLPCTPPPPPAPQATVALSTSTSSAAVLTGADGTAAAIQLTEEQLEAIAAFGRIAQLDIEAGAVTDTSSVGIQARSDIAISVEPDTMSPSMVSAAVSGPTSVTVAFSEDLADATVDASDFVVRGHTVTGVTELKGTVDITLSSRITNASGQTVRVLMVGSVSDLDGNALNGAISDIYADAPNDLTFAGVSTFTVSSDNANPAYARTGDTVTLEFTADADIMPASVTTVLFNSNDAASVSGITARGFTATYQVGQLDPNGPLEIQVVVFTDDAASVFRAADLTSGGVTVDNVSPSYLSASLAGMQSVHVHYSEPVKTSAQDYTLIRVVCDDCLPQDASAAANPGPSSHVLVSWATMVPGADERQLEFDVGAGVTDLAGNPLSNPGAKVMEPPENLEAVGRLQLDSSAGGMSGVALSYDTLVHTVVAPPETVPVIDLSAFRAPDSALPFVAAAGGNQVQFPAGRGVTVDTDSSSVTFPPMVQAGGFPDQQGADAGSTITVAVSQKSPAKSFMDLYPEVDPESALILEFGRADVDLAFSMPVRVQLKSDILPDSTVFTIDSAGNTKEVLACGASVTDAGSADAFISSSIKPRESSTVDGEACVDKDFNVIWTRHFSAFGLSLPAPSAGGSSCDDCTPPTLGRSQDGSLVVASGFAYNGREANVDLFFTAYPRIETAVGSANVATIKIYENGGPDNVQHASLAFGLRSGQVISESTAALEWHRDHLGAESLTSYDPHGVFDSAALLVESSEVPCAPGSELTCLQLEFYHTFRSPLEFDIVGTDVWDAERNAWQNYFNHGLRITGDSLNEQPGILIDGMRLYPLREGSGHVTVMSDGAGQLYRLSPDGAYRPLTNSSSLYGQADESMWIQARPGAVPMGGYDRHDPRFEGTLEAERAAALEVLASLTRNAPLENPEFGAPAELVYHEQTYMDRASDERLRAGLLAEQLRAAALYESMFGNRR